MTRLEQLDILAHMNHKPRDSQRIFLRRRCDGDFFFAFCGEQVSVAENLLGFNAGKSVPRRQRLGDGFGGLGEVGFGGEDKRRRERGRLPLRAGQAQHAPEQLLHRPRRAEIGDAAQHIRGRAIPSLRQFLHRDDKANRAFRRSDVACHFVSILAGGAGDLARGDSQIVDERLPQRVDRDVVVAGVFRLKQNNRAKAGVLRRLFQFGALADGQANRFAPVLVRLHKDGRFNHIAPLEFVSRNLMRDIAGGGFAFGADARGGGDFENPRRRKTREGFERKIGTSPVRLVDDNDGAAQFQQIRQRMGGDSVLVAQAVPKPNRASRENAASARPRFRKLSAPLCRRL